MGSDRWVGTILGERYQIEELLGQGGMSAVYRANDMNLQRPVAIKLIHPHLTHNAEFVRRFETEATAIAKLRHPNIVQVYDLNHGGDLYYMVLEYVAGETLQEHIQQMNAAGNQLPVPEALRYILQICGAAHYAHQHGMIHRDIKPANIMIDPSGSAILMDFGIARIVEGQEHTATGTLLGTALYMSPEQIQGLHPDARSDIYAIGVTLFEVLSGRPPFEADSVMTLMLKHLHDPVPDLNQLHPGIPEVVKAIVNRALEKSPADRFQSCAEMAAALQQALDVLSGAKLAPPVQKKERPAAQETVIEPRPKAAPEHTVLEPMVHRPPAVTDERTVIESATVREPAPARWAEAVQPAAPPARKKRVVWPFAAILLIALLGGGLLFYNQVFSGQTLPLPLATGTQAPAVMPNTSGPQPIAPFSTSPPTDTPAPTLPPTAVALPAPSDTATTMPVAAATATNRPTRARVLWDSSHGPHMSSHENPPNYDPTGVYSNLAGQMVSANISIETNIEDLDSLDLTAYQAVVINQWSAERRAYSETEAANLAFYVENGGGLLILADLESTNKSVAAVCERFDVQCYRAPAIRSVNTFTPHSITNGVSELIFGSEGGALFTSDRSTVVGTAGGNPTLIAIDHSPGRVVIVGDGNLFDNDYLSQKDDKAFALNVFRWITGMSE